MTHVDPNAGGFLLSPPASIASSTSITSPRPPATTTPLLPNPRTHPLPSGSQKESLFIAHVDSRLLAISRRYENRSHLNLEEEEEEEEGKHAGGPPSQGISGRAAGEDVAGKGYADFGEMARELGAVVDVVWVSGTPSLQTPYLLTMAQTIITALPSFPFAPKATFWLLKKLDVALCSLLRGADVETGETLPGFGGGRGRLSVTEKVRMRGVVERTRVKVVDVAGSGGVSVGDGVSGMGGGGGMLTASETEGGDDDEDDEEDFNATITTDDDEGVGVREDMRVDGNHGRWEMEVARVYERTIVELGMALDIGSPGGGGFG